MTPMSGEGPARPINHAAVPTTFHTPALSSAQRAEKKRKRAQKQTKKGAPRGPKYLSAKEWAALPPEEKEKIRAQREAAKAAREAQE